MKKMTNRASERSKAVTIVGGGVLHSSHLEAITQAPVVIGVDRGALWLLKHGVVPHIAIGDFDSVSPHELNKIKKTSARTMSFPPEKDETDLELALIEAIRLKPTTVYLYGVLGRRFDHTLGAVAMLRRLVSHNIYGEIVDNFSRINIVRRGRKKFSRDSRYRYLSVIPLEKGTVLTLSGFRYDINHSEIHVDTTRGISNEIRAPFATLTVHRGLVLTIQSSDTRVR